MSKTILIVEDNLDMRSGLQVSLELEGYNVLTANDGEEAMTLLAASLPDLVLADLKMPHMDGLQLLDEIQSHETWHNIPVVVVTAVAEPSIQSDATWRGAYAYITKPFELNTLLDTIAEAIHGQSCQRG